MRPMPVTDAVLVSSNVPETDEAPYDPGAVYPVNTKVMVLATHSVYQNTLEGATGKYPPDNPDVWVRIRATNRHRCFDFKNSAVTAQAGTISKVFAPGRPVPMVAALSLKDCFSVRVRMVDPVYGEVVNRIITPAPKMVRSNWWEFFFGERVGGSTQAIFDNLPSYPNAQLFVDFVGGPGLSVGLLVFGQPRGWGVGIEWGAQVGRKIRTTVDENRWGDLDITKLPSAKIANYDLLIENEEVDPFLNYLPTIDADFCLFVGAGPFESLVIFGLFRSHRMVLKGEVESVLQLQLLGVSK